MESHQEKKIQKVQEAKRGSLTPKTEKSRVEEELAFFKRSSRTPRSPPQTSEVSGRKAELGTVSLMAQTISPPPATFKFTGSNPEDQFTALENPSHSEDVETELLKGMSDLVESMLQTLKVQRNVNSGIKEGLPKLKDQLQQMMDLVLRRLNQRAGTSEKKLPGRRRASCPSPEAKSPSDQRPTISTMERAAQVSPRGLTRPQDASERELPPDSKLSGDGRHMKRAEAACKELRYSGGETPISAQETQAKKTQVRGNSDQALRGTKAKAEDTATVVKSIRRTQNGDVLLEPGNSADKANFAASLKAALREKGAIRELDPKFSVEIRDLDGLSTED
ncbi:hypothetical protein J6590_074797 [Homalodisca vitripennis]|nr:hypothetical protein J6590_074797 [Homalodisca vitripennis]